MTKTRTCDDFLDVPRLAARHYERGRREHHITCLFRPGGHRLLPDEHFRIYPSPLPSLKGLWADRAQRVFGATVVLRGEARVVWADHARRVAAGDVVVFSGERGDAFRFEDGANFVEASVSFDGPTARGLKALGLWPGVETRRVDPRAARVHYEGLYHAIEVQSLSDPEVLRRAVALLGWLEGGGWAAEDADESFAARACALLRERSEPTARLEPIAAHFGISAAQFRRRFRTTMGVSPRAYQLRERMTRAAAMLGAWNVQQTALALGYSDPFVFSRQFKARFGLCPRAFRAGLPCRTKER